MSEPSTQTFDLDAARAALASGTPFAFENVDVIGCQINGQTLRFAVDMERDPIQRHHRNGRFYEEKELQHLQELFPKGGTFVDIGANTGNHSLFVAKYLQPARIFPVEPNPLAYRLLLANVMLNECTHIFDLSGLGIGLSDKSDDGYGMEKRHRNLGAARMLPGEGTLKVVPGDELLRGLEPSVLKIDVEGMELSVLAGLTEVIARVRPHLMVEVDNVNAEAFEVWCEDNGYVLRHTIQRYKAHQNHILSAKERVN